MELRAHISKNKAILAGSNEYGIVTKDIDITSLSSEQRDELSIANDNYSIFRDGDALKNYNQGVLDLDHLKIYLSDHREKRLEEEARAKAEYEVMISTAREAIAQRKTTTRERVSGRGGYDAAWTETLMDIPDRGRLPVEMLETQEVMDWEADLQKINQAERAKADQKVNDLHAEDKRRERKEREDRETWIKELGSDRLKACLAEGIEYMAIYRDERLAIERPGWVWYQDTIGSYDEPRNPPAEAIDLLTEARQVSDKCKLVYWTADADDVGKEEDWHGYAVVEKYNDNREIVFGLPEELINDE